MQTVTSKALMNNCLYNNPHKKFDDIKNYYGVKNFNAIVITSRIKKNPYDPFSHSHNATDEAPQTTHLFLFPNPLYRHSPKCSVHARSGARVCTGQLPNIPHSPAPSCTRDPSSSRVSVGGQFREISRQGFSRKNLSVNAQKMVLIQSPVTKISLHPFLKPFQSPVRN